MFAVGSALSYCRLKHVSAVQRACSTILDRTRGCRWSTIEDNMSVVIGIMVRMVTREYESNKSPTDTLPQLTYFQAFSDDRITRTGGNNTIMTQKPQLTITSILGLLRH